MTFQTRLILHNILYNIDLISGRQFEFYTAYLFKLLGYDVVKVTKPARDYGTDVILKNHKGVKIGIQCKHINEHDHQDVGYRAVEEAISGKIYHRLDNAVAITNQLFSPNAIKGSKRCGVTLLDRTWIIKKLLHLISKNFQKQQINIIQFLSPNMARNSNKSDAKVFNGADSRAVIRISKREWNKLFRNVRTIKQLQLILYLINNIHRKSNKIRCKYTTIYNELHISCSAVLDTYKLLKELDLAKFHLGWAFINPKLLTYGSAEKRTAIYNDYYYSQQKWWQDMDDNDEFTAKSKRAMRKKNRKAKKKRHKRVIKLYNANYSIRQVAMRANVAHGTVSRILNRNKNKLTPKSLYRLQH